jgi:hypothetical protein
MWDIRMERKQECLKNTELEVEYEGIMLGFFHDGDERYHN